MRYKPNISKLEREKIFEIFLKKDQQKFSDIEKSLSEGKLKIRSNHLDYHLKQMIKDNILVKEKEFYKLTKEAEKMIPFFAHVTGKETGALPVVLVAIVDNKNQICLLKRKKRPYKGYWGVIGGKLKMEESIAETAVREAKEETNLDCEFQSINAIVHERVKENDEFKHGFVLFFTKVKPLTNEHRGSEEGEVRWFDMCNLKGEKIIPSDGWMIKKYVNSKSNVSHVVMEERDGELIKLELLK